MPLDVTVLQEGMSWIPRAGIAIVAQTGDAHRPTPTTTGDAHETTDIPRFDELRAFLRKALGKHCCKSMSDALA